MCLRIESARAAGVAVDPDGRTRGADSAGRGRQIDRVAGDQRGGVLGGDAIRGDDSDVLGRTGLDRSEDEGTAGIVGGDGDEGDAATGRDVEVAAAAIDGSTEAARPSDGDIQEPVGGVGPAPHLHRADRDVIGGRHRARVGRDLHGAHLRAHDHPRELDGIRAVDGDDRLCGARRGQDRDRVVSLERMRVEVLEADDVGGLRVDRFLTHPAAAGLPAFGRR